MGAGGEALKQRHDDCISLIGMMNLFRAESQLASLARLVPHLTEHGCDISAQDAARSLIRYFDAAPLAQGDKVVGDSYASLRDRLEAVAAGRLRRLPMDQVAAFSRLYREQMLRAEIGAFVDQYRCVPLGQLDLAALLSDLMRILREHGLALPPDLALLVKAFITLEGMGRQLDPDFDMVAEAAPWLREAMIAQYSPAALTRRGRRACRP